MWHHLSCKEPGTAHGPNCRLPQGSRSHRHRARQPGDETVAAAGGQAPDPRPGLFHRHGPHRPGDGHLESGGLWPALSLSPVPGLPSFLPLSPGLTTMTVGQSFPGQTDRVPPWTAQHSVLEPPGSSMEQMAQKGREGGASQQSSQCCVRRAAGGEGRARSWETEGKQVTSCLRVVTVRPGHAAGPPQIPRPSCRPGADAPHPHPQGCGHAAQPHPQPSPEDWRGRLWAAGEHGGPEPSSRPQ